MEVHLNQDGWALIWDESTVDTLRTQHRILSRPIGNTPIQTKGSQAPGLPAVLMPELAHLASDRGWVKLVESSQEPSFEVLSPELLSIRKLVCHDLWEKGYYIGSGGDYGGDFIVYPADPSITHSVATICVLQSHDQVDCQLLCGRIRLQQSVAKILMYAIVHPDHRIEYIRLEHEGTSRMLRQLSTPPPLLS